MVESISVNKLLGIALRLLDCPSDQIKGKCSSAIGRRACRQGTILIPSHMKELPGNG